MAVRAARERVEQRLVERDELIVRAPFDGVISQRYADPGAFVTPTTTASATAGATSSSIVELSEGLEVVAKVPESDIGRLKLGLPASVRVDAFPDRRFRARVRQIAPRAVKTNNVTSFEVKLQLLDPAPELRIGMTADIDFQTGTLQARTLVPTVAIVTEDGRPGVLLVGKGQEPTFQPVELGASSGKDTQILTGLEQRHKGVHRPAPLGQEAQLSGGQPGSASLAGASGGQRDADAEKPARRLHDPAAGLTVAEGIVGPGHGAVSLRVLQQPAGLRQDRFAVSADQLRRAGLHRLGPLGGATQHQHRLAQSRGFLLQTARIGEQQGAAPHGRHQPVVVERFGEEGSWMGPEQGLQGLPHGGIAVQGQQQGGVGETFEQHPEIPCRCGAAARPSSRDGARWPEAPAGPASPGRAGPSPGRCVP